MKNLTTTTKLCTSLATLALTGTTFAQVAGDECANAIAAIQGANPFNTTTMTPSANPPADGSCTFLDWGASKDVWFSWSAPADGTANISLCGSAYDTSMVVYAGACGTAVIACNDDSCGAAYESVIPALAVTGGTTYYIRIGGWQAASGAGTMNLGFTSGGGGPVDGDECTNALIAVDGDNAFDTTTMTPSANAPADETCTYLDWGASKDVWFKWNPSATGTATLSMCGLINYDSSMVVYQGADCATTARIACDDDTCGPAYESIITGLFVSDAETYYIRIGGYNAASGAGALNIAIEPGDATCASASGSCAEPHGGLGCDDPSCCSAVCAINPLCCIIGWDADCVNFAVDACGLFFYTCTQGTPANDCATNAQVVSDGSYPFSTVGATLDGNMIAGATCASGSDNFYNDVWYKFTSLANGSATISTCGTTSFDNKLAVYDMGTDPASFSFNSLPDVLVACNDDGTNCLLTDGVTPYASELSAPCVAGHTYLVRNGSYADGDTGSGTIQFTLPAACSLPTATGSEGEACGDNTNGGCDAATGAVMATPINAGDVIAGSFWADADTRDTDWYSFTITAEKQVTWSLYSNQFAAAYILSGDPCTDAAIVAAGAGECPQVATACLDAGTYYVWAGTADFTGTPCGSGGLNDYVASLEIADADCPEATDVCDNEGPDNASQSTDLSVTEGGVACGAGGITTPNTYCRTFSGLSSGAIHCVSVGVQNTASNMTVSIGVYKDTDGGLPTAPDVDLELLGSKTFAVPAGWLDLTTVRFDEPICLDGNTQPIVVVLDCADATDGWCGYGSNPNGTSAEMYILSTACGINTFTAMTDIGFPGENMVVNINGDFSTCGGGIPCPTDLNGDGATNGADLAMLLASWGGAGGDTNGDGTTNGADLSAVLAVFGSVCP